jgi:hypothetical protein
MTLPTSTTTNSGATLWRRLAMAQPVSADRATCPAPATAAAGRLGSRILGKITACVRLPVGRAWHCTRAAWAPGPLVPVRSNADIFDFAAKKGGAAAATSQRHPFAREAAKVTKPPPIDPEFPTREEFCRWLDEAFPSRPPNSASKAWPISVPGRAAAPLKEPGAPGKNAGQSRGKPARRPVARAASPRGGDGARLHR